MLCIQWQIVQGLCFQHLKLTQAALVELQCLCMAPYVATWHFMWSQLRFLKKKRCQILHLKCQVLARLKCQVLHSKCQVLFTFEVPDFALQVPGFDQVEVSGFALQVPGFDHFEVSGFVLFEVPGFVQKSARKRTSLVSPQYLSLLHGLSSCAAL